MMSVINQEAQTMTTLRSLLTELFQQHWLAVATNALVYIPLTAAMLCGLAPVPDEVLKQAGIRLRQ